MYENRYTVNQSLAIEFFKDGSLIFFPEACRLIRVNHLVREILRCMDGKRTVGEIILKIAPNYDTSLDAIYRDVSAVLADLSDNNVLRNMGQLERVKDYNAMDDIKYSINQDVSCRIENTDGAILFNPETDAVQVINPTGLAIWQILDYPRKKHEIVEHLLTICEDVPEDQVVQDVEEFLQKLKTDGFIGEVIE